MTAALAAACISAPARSPSSVVTAPSPAPPSNLEGPAAGGVTEIVVGGLAVEVADGSAPVTPALDKAAASAVVAGELAAGRARVLGTHLGVPPMHVIDGVFVPGLIRIFSPAGGPNFEAPTPVAAWVVVTEGRGADGVYIGVGVVGQDGTPIATYVISPGVG